MSKDIKKFTQEAQDRIRDMAYQMWESAGRHQGMAMEYWLAAEREVMKTWEKAADAIKGKKADGKPSADEHAKPEPAPKPAAAAPAAKPAPAPKPAPAEKPAPAAKAAPAAKPAPAPSVAASPKSAAGKPAAGKTGYKIETIEGIGPAYGAKLAAAGIETTGDLLEKCGSAKGRDATAAATGLATKQLLAWANMADLMRIAGIGGEYAELLEASGVDTVKELKMRRADSLSKTMGEVNAKKKLTRRVPSAKQVEKWVTQAGSLEPVITH